VRIVFQVSFKKRLFVFTAVSSLYGHPCNLPVTLSPFLFRELWHLIFLYTNTPTQVREILNCDLLGVHDSSTYQIMTESVSVQLVSGRDLLGKIGSVRLRIHPFDNNTSNASGFHIFFNSGDTPEWRTSHLKTCLKLIDDLRATLTDPQSDINHPTQEAQWKWKILSVHHYVIITLDLSLPMTNAMYQTKSMNADMYQTKSMHTDMSHQIEKFSNSQILLDLERCHIYFRDILDGKGRFF
jgi:hypothetical protein